MQEDLEDLPSSAPELLELSIWADPRARRDAAQETGLALATSPEACPWPIAQGLAEDFGLEETSCTPRTASTSHAIASFPS